jgi:hypothetical protein
MQAILYIWFTILQLVAGSKGNGPDSERSEVPIPQLVMSKNLGQVSHPTLPLATQR